MATKKYLTYEALKSQEHRIPEFFSTWIPKMTNRAQFKPEFDYAHVYDAAPGSEHIATVRVGMIETILRPMNFTYTYHVYPASTVFAPDPRNGSTGARPYGYPVEKWADAVLKELNPEPEEEKIEITGTLETPDLHDHGVN